MFVVETIATALRGAIAVSTLKLERKKEYE